MMTILTVITTQHNKDAQVEIHVTHLKPNADDSTGMGELHYILSSLWGTCSEQE
jgi:hypothetical protein